MDEHIDVTPRQFFAAIALIAVVSRRKVTGEYSTLQEDVDNAFRCADMLLEHE